MTVRELIASLQMRPDQDAIVILAKDREGNGFSPVDAILDVWYVAHNTYSGEIKDVDYAAGEDSSAVPAVVLWPVN